MEIIKVEKTLLKENAIYTGDVLIKDGDYIPHGWGKKIFPDNSSVTGVFENGEHNGLMYYNQHTEMYLGYMNKHKYMNGWGIYMSQGDLFFGVWKESILFTDLSDQVQWMLFKINEENYQKNYLHVYPKADEIFLGIPGQKYDNFQSLSTGYHCMVNGDIYVGACPSGLKKTGLFIKYNGTGNIQIGEFNDGELTKELDIQELLDRTLGKDNSKNELQENSPMSILSAFKYYSSNPRTMERHKYNKLTIDTNKKYF